MTLTILGAIAAALVVAGSLLDWRIALALCLAYLSLLTLDPAGIPVSPKIPLVALALATWATARRDRRWFRLGPAVLAVAVGLPALWLIAFALEDLARGDARSPFALEHAGRFVYLLLFFPIADVLRRSHGLSMVMAPIVALAALTVGLFLGGRVLGLFELPSVGAGQRWIVFSGVIGETPTGFRLFFGNHVLLVAGAALATAFLLGSRVRVLSALSLVVILAAAGVSQTRGIQLGVAVAVVVALVARGLGVADPPRIVRRGLIGVLFAGGLAVAAYLVAGIADPVDQSLALRRDQAPWLMEAFWERPLVGWGLGAVLESGYARSVSAPWSFELTYLQLLFQLGAIGTAVMLALPALAAIRGFRDAASPAGPGDGRMAAAGTGAVAGILASAATNPYLFSSFGMLALALALALVEASRQPAVPSAPRRGVSRLPALHSVLEPRGRRWGLAAVTTLAVVAATLAGWPSAQPQALQAAPIPSSHGTATIGLRTDAWLDRRAVFTTDGEEPVRVLWAIDPDTAGREVRVEGFDVRDGRRLSSRRVLLAPEMAGDAFDIGIWEATPALFVFVADDRGIDVRVVRVADSQVVMSGRAPARRETRPGAVRDLAVASWSGGLPDLFVVNRSDTGPTRLAVYSGESGFGQVIERARPPLPPMGVECCDVDVVPMGTGRPDLLAVVRGGVLSGQRPGAFAFSGDDGYQVPLARLSLASPPLDREDAVAGGFLGGARELFVVNRPGAALRRWRLPPTGQSR